MLEKIASVEWNKRACHKAIRDYRKRKCCYVLILAEPPNGNVGYQLRPTLGVWSDLVDELRMKIAWRDNVDVDPIG